MPVIYENDPRIVPTWNTIKIPDQVIKEQPVCMSYAWKRVIKHVNGCWLSFFVLLPSARHPLPGLWCHRDTWLIRHSQTRTINCWYVFCCQKLEKTQSGQEAMLYLPSFSTSFLLSLFHDMGCFLWNGDWVWCQINVSLWQYFFRIEGSSKMLLYSMLANIIKTWVWERRANYSSANICSLCSEKMHATLRFDFVSKLGLHTLMETFGKWILLEN